MLSLVVSFTFYRDRDYNERALNTQVSQIPFDVDEELKYFSLKDPLENRATLLAYK